MKLIQRATAWEREKEGRGGVYYTQCHNTVNREYFDVKIFSDSMACAKIKRTKYMRNINDNAVLIRKLFNIKNYRMKYFRHSVFAFYGTYKKLRIQKCGNRLL